MNPQEQEFAQELRQLNPIKSWRVRNPSLINLDKEDSWDLTDAERYSNYYDFNRREYCYLMDSTKEQIIEFVRNYTNE